ncbi:TniB family NTP-binding protein [Brevibacterium oceani]|uniref:TniB family NTP-binding protein n=1 Tax=Brevibacterium oceani TaxID=358099 RepID=UPI002159C9E9|nr:TniB family NTP-binding protein [Brevibacterium oceani]
MATKQGWDAFAQSAPRPALEHLSRTELDRLTDEEREDYDEARMVWNANPPAVKTAQLSSAFSIMDQVMASNRRDGDRLRGSIVIDAAPALGKTTIATRFAREFHRKTLRRFGGKTGAGHQRLPVAFIPLDAGVTLKGLNQKILAFYGHPGAHRATTARLGALAVDCVRSCETQLIVLDDLHFIDFKHRHGREVSNHLKGLANEMPVTFVYVGVRLAEKRFFDEGLLGEDAAYAQTSRRSTRVPVAPFSHNTNAGARAWSHLLTKLEEHLLLVDREPGMLLRQATELHRRTQGHIGSLTNLLDRASYLAITTGVETINAEILSMVTIDNAAETSARTA